MPVFDQASNTLVHWVASLDSGAAIVMRCSIYERFERLFSGVPESLGLKETYRDALTALDARDEAFLIEMGFSDAETGVIILWLERHLDAWRGILGLGAIVGLPMKLTPVVGDEDVTATIEGQELAVTLHASDGAWKFIPTERYEPAREELFTPNPKWAAVHEMERAHWEGSELVTDDGRRLVLTQPKA
jgi:hypothetical protein